MAKTLARGKHTISPHHSGALGALIGRRWSIDQNADGTYYINEYHQGGPLTGIGGVGSVNGASPMLHRDTLLDRLSLDRAQRIVKALEAARARIVKLTRTLTPYHRLPVEIR